MSFVRAGPTLQADTRPLVDLSFDVDEIKKSVKEY